MGEKVESQLVRFLDVDVPENYIEQGSEILDICFRKDPGLLFLTQSQQVLDICLKNYFRILLKDKCLARDFYLENDKVVGVFISSPCNQDPDPAALLNEDFLLSDEQLNQIVERVIRFTNFIDKKRYEFISQPHWRYNFLGITPSHQGQGIGSQMLQFTKQESLKKPGDIIYFETSQSQNVPFYQRNGFKFIGEFEVPDQGPHFFVFIGEK